MSNRDVIKVRSHDSICGVLYLASGLLANFFQMELIFLGLGVGVLQLISPVTKFCPVYFVLNKIMPDTVPIQNGK
jgi:hypothetical protein